MRPTDEFEKDWREYSRVPHTYWPSDDIRHDVDLIVKRKKHAEIYDEMTERFRAFCKELRQMGYEILWVNSHPHSSGLQGPSHVVAEPKRQREHFPTIWTAKTFSHGCGNGLQKADQMQLRIDMPSHLWGKYDLTKFDEDK